jgi:hypothetical protein
MQGAFQLRRKFISFLEDIYRELGHLPPEIPRDEDEPLVMEIESDEIAFEIIHSPQSHPERLLVHCQFGPVPQEQTIDVLTALLRANQILFRSREGVLGIDAETDVVTYSFAQSLDMVRASDLLQNLTQVAQRAKEWRTAFYLDRMPTSMKGISYDSCHAVTEISETELTHNRQRFLALVNDTCKAFDMHAPNTTTSDDKGAIVVQMKVEDMSFSALHIVGAVSQFLLESDIGPVPAERTREALRWLLRLNHDLACRSGAIFGINAISGNILCLWLEELEKQTGEILRDKMIEISSLQASHWNEIYILDEDRAEVSPDTPLASLALFLEYA